MELAEGARKLDGTPRLFKKKKKFLVKYHVACSLLHAEGNWKPFDLLIKITVALKCVKSIEIDTRIFKTSRKFEEKVLQSIMHTFTSNPYYKHGLIRKTSRYLQLGSWVC